MSDIRQFIEESMLPAFAPKVDIEKIRERHELNWTGAEHMQTQAEIDRRDLLKEVSRIGRDAEETLAILNELDGEFDRQLYQERSREEQDAPDEREYSVNITAKQVRVLAALVLKLSTVR